LNTPKLHAVVTTIHPPTASVRALCRALRPLNASVLIVGDRKGPSEYPLAGSELLTLERQLTLPLRLPRLLPLNHYVRKNIGYLTLISRGAECLYEADDDNCLTDKWQPRRQRVKARAIQHPKWFNVFRHFSDERIWPRGFPLTEIAASNQRKMRGRAPWATVESPIQQGLVDLHPDVDAIWRLVMEKPFHFHDGDSVALMPGVWCPFNSQNTWWFPAAYPLLYLPSHCTFRMTDIWRSFVAQRCLWTMEGMVTFHCADVIQRRNLHSLLQDFQEEVPGYLANERICHTLEDLKLERGPEATGENLVRCYQALVAQGVFPKKELLLVRAWLKDLDAIARGLAL
jgi:hypothetical protein